MSGVSKQARAAFDASADRLYRSGMSMHDVALELGCTSERVGKALKRAGTPRRTISQALTQTKKAHGRRWTSL